MKGRTLTTSLWAVALLLFQARSALAQPQPANPPSDPRLLSRLLEETFDEASTSTS